MNKEEIAKAKKYLDIMGNKINFDLMEYDYGNETIDTILDYIQQLEEREQKVKEIIKQLELDEQNTRNIKNNKDYTIKNGRFVNYVDDYRRCRLKAYMTKTREIKNRLLNLYNDKEG